MYYDQMCHHNVFSDVYFLCCFINIKSQQDGSAFNSNLEVEMMRNGINDEFSYEDPLRNASAVSGKIIVMILFMEALMLKRKLTIICFRH